MSSLDEVRLKLEKIRAFDSLIDFAKSRIQLDIVLELAYSHKPLSADDIAKAIGQRKKPVLDALRKLEIKGIIKRVDNYRNIYELTDLGKQMILDLTSILGASSLKEVARSRLYGKVSARDLIKLLIPVYYLYEVIVALGTSKKHELPLTSLASSVGISPQRLTVYLDPYSDPKSEVRLFKKVRKEDFKAKIKSIILGSRRTTTYYKLTNLGLELFYRLPVYMKTKNSYFNKLLIRLMGYYNPKSFLLKFSLIDLVMITIALILLFTTPTHMFYTLPIASILGFKVFISLITLLSCR